VHTSCISHKPSPATGRQTVFCALKVSVGQVLCTPSQDSVTSQVPFEGRHTAVDFKSVGQAADEPEHESATSHIPLAGLQIVLVDANL
jgi:hypothetical protein